MRHGLRVRLGIFVCLAAVIAGCGGVRLGTSEGGGTSAVAPSAPSAPSNAAAPERDAGAPYGGAAAGTGPAGDAALPTQDATRLLIRTGAMDLVVRSVADSAEAVRQTATAVDGFVSDSSLSGSGTTQAATLTLRVPVDRFAEVMGRLEGLAVEVRAVTTNSRDVTEEVTDIEATLRNLRAVEAQYTALLARSNSVTEVLQVQERLNQTRLQIDRTEARRKLLASQAEMATLTVTLHSVAAAGSGRLAQIQQAWHASLELIDRVATGAVVLVVYLWWVVPIALVALVIGLRTSRAPRRAPPSADRPAP